MNAKQWLSDANVPPVEDGLRETILAVCRGLKRVLRGQDPEFDEVSEYDLNLERNPALQELDDILDEVLDDPKPVTKWRARVPRYRALLEKHRLLDGDELFRTANDMTQRLDTGKEATQDAEPTQASNHRPEGQADRGRGESHAAGNEIVQEVLGLDVQGRQEEWRR